MFLVGSFDREFLSTIGVEEDISTSKTGIKDDSGPWVARIDFIDVAAHCTRPDSPARKTNIALGLEKAVYQGYKRCSSDMQFRPVDCQYWTLVYIYDLLNGQTKLAD